jgi:lipopolysaccharide/colanic/teichoic acid biosynthesis glycosyltransferase
VLILGTDGRSREIAAHLVRRAEPPTRIVGHVELGTGPPDAGLSAPVVPLEDLPGRLARHDVDEVFSGSRDCGEAIGVCVAAGVPLTVLSELPGAPSPAEPATPAAGPATRRTPGLVLKRTLDVTGAALGLLVAAPVLLLAALAVQLASPGPVLARQTRCGLHGRRFPRFQLRTAAPHPPGGRETATTRTRIGQLVHASGIDELPTLWNVLRGDMSLVGPRPPLPSELSRSGPVATRRLSMRPGLTCLWQLSEQPALGPDECAKLDLQYVDGWSLGTDLKILALTLPAVLRGACD